MSGKRVTEEEMYAHIRRWPNHHAWSGHGEPFWSTSLVDYVGGVKGSTIAHAFYDGDDLVFEIFEPSLKAQP